MSQTIFSYIEAATKGLVRGMLLGAAGLLIWELISRWRKKK